ncbi:uncharacterized protein CLAFUR5_11740 [Fulvia fulva]|uniref:Uncharacterized protein n=1 Tax=Passalora fulva TaxID=5499 RepID=A0A9Q8UU71_PASFU|nr:uncharacterized protein CLAFUR5_11740 [Fulvia fulva]KAK4627511.1 hypothetical protein CLAFUR0_05158 [Fulvia fulva]UJO22497.1 hypothetical protein CLAFUR5_11740 [Fulvia fulva]WPV29314.1 hypothetical protein CLAFUW7_05162 [Fulvia fulva]
MYGLESPYKMGPGGMTMIKQRFYHWPDLPAELRLNAYDIALVDHYGVGSVNLRFFTMPTLAYLNQEARNYLLPVIFDKTQYHLNIDSNLVDRFLQRKQLRLTNTWNSSIRQCGLTWFKLKKRKLILAIGKQAIFKQVTINIMSTEWGFVHRNITKADEIVASLELRVVGKVLGIEVKTGEYHPDNTARFPLGFNGRFAKEDVDATVAGMREVAVKLGGREGFAGLSLEDLDKIVKPARHVVSQSAFWRPRCDWEIGERSKMKRKVKTIQDFRQGLSHECAPNMPPSGDGGLAIDRPGIDERPMPPDMSSMCGD